MNGVLNRLLVCLVELLRQLVLVFNSVPHGVDVVRQGVPSIDLVFDKLVLLGEFLAFTHHSLNFLRRQSTLRVGDRDSLFLPNAFFNSCDCHNTVFINLESDFDLGDATSSRWDPC